MNFKKLDPPSTKPVGHRNKTPQTELIFARDKWSRRPFSEILSARFPPLCWFFLVVL